MDNKQQMKRQQGPAFFNPTTDRQAKLILRSSMDSKLSQNTVELKKGYKFKINLIERSEDPHDFTIQIQSNHQYVRLYEQEGHSVRSYHQIEFIFSQKNRQYISNPPQEDYFKRQNFIYFYAQPQQMARAPSKLSSFACDQTQIIDASERRIKENEKKMKMLVFSEDEEDSQEDIEEEKQVVSVQKGAKEEAIHRRVISTPSYERPSPSQDYSSKSSKVIPESYFEELKKSEQEVRRFEPGRVIDDTQIAEISESSETQRPQLSSDTEELNLSSSSLSSDYAFSEYEEDDDDDESSQASRIIDEILDNRTPNTARRPREPSSGVIEDTPYRTKSRGKCGFTNTIDSDDENSPVRRHLHLEEAKRPQRREKKDRRKESSELKSQISLKATTVASYMKAVRRSHQKREAQLSQRKEEEKKEEELCMICMSEIKTPARPQNCTHLFCLDCLKQWSLQTNVCPLCRVQFRGIVLLSGEKAMSVAKQKFRLPAEYYDEDVRAFINEACMYCSDDDDQEYLMICDECGSNLAHSFCVGLTEVPQTEWYCVYCSPHSYTDTHRYLLETELRGERQVQSQRNREAEEQEQNENNRSLQDLFARAMHVLRRAREEDRTQRMMRRTTLRPRAPEVQRMTRNRNMMRAEAVFESLN